MKTNYQSTIGACFTGYMVQAVVNNFAPLLFLTFHSIYEIPLSKITMLVTFNFGLQLVIDFLSAGFIDKIGYRASALLAHVLSAAGLILLTVLPGIFHDPFIGLLFAVTIYAMGGGLLEVLVSPIVEACPTDNKEKVMSLLHSFYCWGQVSVVLLSTIFFAVFGTENWKLLSLLWALLPICNAIAFARVPIASLHEEGQASVFAKKLIQNKGFWILVLLMICAGASEQSVSQWASTFAEQGLGVSKTIGDLAGPMFFAIMMGIARMIYGKYGDRMNLEQFMGRSGMICLFSYLLISMAPFPFLSLLGCGICGFSVGILWPGTFSIAAKTIKGGGTAMFAYLALAGDLGASLGPTAVGYISSLPGSSLKAGLAVAVIFPILMLAGLYQLSSMTTKETHSSQNC